MVPRKRCDSRGVVVKSRGFFRSAHLYARNANNTELMREDAGEGAEPPSPDEATPTPPVTESSPRTSLGPWIGLGETTRSRGPRFRRRRPGLAALRHRRHHQHDGRHHPVRASLRTCAGARPTKAHVARLTQMNWPADAGYLDKAITSGP